uniref:Glucose-6-phosphate exchanger SLC37A2-like n=1 Tax=Hirondellea gigas TaxID=1518452 RepID=A0A2P2I1Z2_9CRUS
MFSKIIVSQHLMLSLLWLAYASAYLLRKPLALVKADLISELHFSTQLLGWLDVALWLPYAGVSLTMGRLADKLGARNVLGFGLFLSAVSTAGIGYSSTFGVMFLLSFGTGAFQALCWPASCTILGSWFKQSEKNYAFGLFGTSCFVGGVLATYLVVYLERMCGWRYIFLPCAVVPAIFGLCIVMFARPPSGYTLTIEGSSTEIAPILAQPSYSSQPRSMTLFQVLRLQLLPEVCASIMFCKCVRYAFMMWLPLFLHDALNYTKFEAGVGSTAYDIGGIFGSLFNGFMVKRFFVGSNLFGACMSNFLMGMFLMVFYVSQGLGWPAHMSLLFMAGLFNSSADLLLTGPVALKLGEKHGASITVCGVVNGMGSIGSVIQGPLIGWIGTTWGWDAVLPVLVAMSLAGGFASLRAYRIQQRKQRAATVQQRTDAMESI